MKPTSILALLCCLPLALPAQSADTARRSGNVCWRGRPALRCDWTVLTELGLEYPVTTTETTQDVGGGATYVARAFEERLTVGGGLLKNVGPRSAVGAIATIGVGNGGRKLVEGRYRQYLDGSTSIDLSAGFLSTHIQPISDVGRGATLAAGLTWRDLIGGHVRFDAVSAGGTTYQSIAAGGHLGQRASVAGGVVLGIGFAILLAIYSGFE